MKQPHGTSLDFGTKLIIVLTFASFVLAVIVKGIGKDILLEIGVLLVSTKLIMMTVKQAEESRAIRQDLDRILNLLNKPSKAQDAKSAQGSTGE